MLKTIACLAVAGATMAANGQELLAWWSFNNSTSDSNLTWFDGNDFLNDFGFGAVFRHMHDNDGTFNDGFLDAANDHMYPVFDGFSINPGALIDPSVVDSMDLNPDISLFGAYIDVSDLAGDNFASVTNPSEASNEWGSFGGTADNRPDGGGFGGGSLAISGPANNTKSFDIVADLSDYQDIEVTWANRGTSTGFTSRTVSVSTDGTNFTQIFSDAGVLSSTWVLNLADAGSMLDNAPNAIIRFTIDGAIDDDNDRGNNRFDNIQLIGTEGMGSACIGDIADDFGNLGEDGMVSFGDFLALLGLLGPCGPATFNPDCIGDIADDFGNLGAADGAVSFGDFLALLGLLGPCP